MKIWDSVYVSGFWVSGFRILPVSVKFYYLFLVRQISEMQRGLVPVDGKVRRSEFELLSGTG